jgi:hypothetical protein
MTSDHVLILALLSERAWAYAMELKVRAPRESKSDCNEENQGIGLRHSRQRLSKATKYGGVMRALCAAAGDDILVLESDAYADWLEGLELESRNYYGRATELLESSRATYQTLAHECGGTLQEVIFRKCAADCLTATQRCAFAGDGGHAFDKHGTLSDKGSTVGAANALTEMVLSGETDVVRWCGVTLEITAEKIQQRLRGCKLEDEPRATAVDVWSGGATGLCCEGSKTAAVSVSLAPNEMQYAKRLQQLEDMAHAARVGCDSERHGDSFSGSDCVTKSKRSLELIAARATYEKLDLLFRRCDASIAERAAAWRRATIDAAAAKIFGADLGSLDDPRLPDDVLHLYDNLIQVTNEMVALAGVRDAKDDALAEALDARAAVLQAYKCHFLAETFSVRVAEAPKAISLLRHASYLADRARQEAEACEASQMSQEMVHLSDASRASASRLKAAHVLDRKQIDNIQIRVPPTSVPPTHLSLLDIHIAPVCAQNPTAASSKPKPAHCKPILFNLAHNHLDLPSFQSKAGRGLFGWLRR